MEFTQLALPLIAIVVSIGTLILNLWRFGREVRIEDKETMMRALAECNKRCEAVAKENEAILAENRRYREENYRLMQRLTNPDDRPSRR